MKVYFVRHGESTLNAKKIHQDSTTPLSKLGRAQAQIVSQRLSGTPIDIIISSDYLRAKQTTEIINRELKKEVIFSPLLRERDIPTEIHGKRFDDPSIQEIKEKIDQNIRDPKYRFSDEETFYDLKGRTKEIVKFIEAREEENILIVLHGSILRYIIYTMMIKTDFKWDDFNVFARFVKTNNTGISLCAKKEDFWQLLTWNDHAHLQDL